jgi:glycosyltransferase involved in cell wall biosynthesis
MHGKRSGSSEKNLRDSGVLDLMSKTSQLLRLKTIKTKRTPLVTIGICVRNSEATIEEAIDSVLVQDFPHELIEVIFVDDGSTDRTLSIIERYVPRMYMTVKIFHHKWKGLGASRNVVVDNASGDYIIWVDGDMILPADHVRKQVEYMERNPKMGIGKAQYGVMPKETIVAILENVPFMVHDINPETMNSNLPGTGGAIYRVEAIRQVGRFDNRLKGTGEDQDAAYRVKAAGWLISQSPAFFYERRVRTWKSLWKKYFWYGYGDYDLYCKNRDIFTLHKMNPIAGFIAGAFYARDAYRLTSSKGVFLLPLHFAFKMVAWCFGFTRAHADSFKNHRQISSVKEI